MKQLKNEAEQRCVVAEEKFSMETAAWKREVSKLQIRVDANKATEERHAARAANRTKVANEIKGGMKDLTA